MERIIRKCLEKEPECRYQSAKELLVDLRNLQRDTEARAQQSKPYDGTIEAANKAQATAAKAMQSTVADGRVERRKPLISRRGVVIALGLVLLLGGLAYALFWRRSAVAPQPQIKSLAILPMKSLDVGENYIGLGIADAVIRRISQTGELIVRPTSAVRRYLNEETDALTAAKQLNADAVLEGNVQRADDRLRVSVNLLRVGDGVSLWSESFDMHSADIFTIQDTVAQQVASRLRLRLNPEQQSRLTKRSTSNPTAYEFYVKGVYNLDQRESASNSIGTPHLEATIDFFKKAIEADPNYALAHAQLAYAYAWIALFIKPTEPVWAESAKEEINQAQTLDPQLAETHVAGHLLLWSGYEGWQNEAAVRELLLAQQLNPSIGHADLASLYQHIGLEDAAARELQRALDIDPTSESAKGQITNLYYMGGKYDEWFAAYQKLYPGKPTPPWYFMGKGKLDDAQKALEEKAAEDPNGMSLPRQKAVLFALKGDFRAAEAQILLTCGASEITG